MANCFKRGKEPTCPLCGVNIVRVRGASSCRKCSTDPGWNGESITGTGPRAEVSRSTSKPVRTLADLARVCEIDTDTWKVRKPTGPSGKTSFLSSKSRRGWSRKPP